MLPDEILLTKYVGMTINSLNNVLNVAINKNEENEIPLIKHSPYVNTDELISFCVEKENNFTILSLNVQSLNAKFDQMQILLSQLKSNRVQFNAICLQETWLTENSDLTSFQIPGYTLISQGAICSSHEGLAIYVQEHYKYKLLSCYQHTTIWEGLLIEIESREFKKKVMIGNMYKPPGERNENYQSFLNELSPVLTHLEKYNDEIILTGDLNINLLKVNQRPIINDFFDIMITNSLYPHITLPTRLSEKSVYLIGNFYCKFTPNVSDVSACILTSGLSDHFPYCISINITCPKAPRVKDVYINNLTKDNIKNFKLEIKNANLLDQINIDQHTDPNINYGVIEDVLIAAKLKHVSRKRVKFSKFKHK